MSISSSIECKNIVSLADLYYEQHLLYDKMNRVHDDIEFLIQVMTDEDITIAHHRFEKRLLEENE